MMNLWQWQGLFDGITWVMLGLIILSLNHMDRR
jgi:hypothetical protein